MYDTDAANNLTKSRAKSALMSKTGRPDINRRVEPGTGDLGPGAYDDGKDFGKGVVGHSFGKPKPEKVVSDDRDYKDFDMNKTRAKSPAAIINKNTPSRPKSFALDTNEGGPGQYDSTTNFGQGLKKMTFDKTARTKPIEQSTGPGQYDPDRAASLTKSRS